MNFYRTGIRWLRRIPGNGWNQLSSPLLVLATLSQPAVAAPSDFTISQEWTVPMKEVSALAYREKTLYLASDHEADILALPFNTEDPASLTLKSLRFLPAHLPARGSSQWEALAIDGKGQFLAAKETTDELFLLAPTGAYQRTWALTPRASLKKSDRERVKKRGYEGLLLLKKGHVLLALSKPTLLIEYGPAGDKPLGVDALTLLGADEAFLASPARELAPLAEWELKIPKKDGCQLSELARSADAHVFALLKDCGRIVELPKLQPSEREFEATTIAQIPSRIEHPEGLLPLADGFLVATDRHEKKTNLYWLKTSQSMMRK